MTDSVVVEGYARLRDGKKWKTRWLVLRKPSPVADCLVLLAYKDKSDKAHGNKEKASFTLEEICGLEAGQWYEGVAFTLAILCLNQAALLGFDSREALQAWDARLRYSLGEVHRFSVGVLPGTKLESGPATLHLCNNLLALARDVPPVAIGHWNLPDLRRYGPVPNGFVFEGGTRCGYWAGVFLLASAESEQISFLFDCIVRGISPTRGPFGLQPVLPDLSACQTHSEEKLNHEAQELEKRLSMLSHRSSAASSAYFPSAGGDDRSISGSSDTSDTSQSDCSIGSRLAAWSEPTCSPPETVGHVAGKGPLQSTEKLSVSQGAGNRPPAKPPRQLQEIGRQSSSDSGIATGSHSSYSGSFSSYTGSLDITPGEDFGSVFSLPPHLAQDLSPCTCSTAPGHEYQVPTSLRFLYESPRSLLQEGSEGTKDNEPSTPTKDPEGLITESGKGVNSIASTSEGLSEATERQPMMGPLHGPSEESQKTTVAPSVEHSDPCLVCRSPTSASKAIVAICTLCGGVKGTPFVPTSGTVVPVIPKRYILNPADQGVETSPCRPDSAGECSLGMKDVLEKSWTPSGSGSACSSVKMNEESPAPVENGEEKLSRFSADPPGFPGSDRRHAYVTMGPAVPNLASKRGSRAVIYENCLKCQNQQCCPPPWVSPAEMYHNGNTFPFQSLTTGLKKSGEEHGAAGNEELLHPAPRDEPQGVEDPNGREDKRPNSKEERRRTGPAYEVMESRTAERNPEAEDKSKYELMGSCGQQRFLQDTEGAVFVFPPGGPFPKRLRSEGVTYVNIPVSPTSKKQLNYMELELQELGPGARGTAAQPPAQRKTFTRYAQIDITATETAHKVGTQHALGRQEGLHTLELRRKGTPH